ncbi:disrupted in schizophrenia 1 protein isoform X1 [Pongo abelii]|uniref:disrupted in schizophrenia 1 protein isoform X1 n=1 Tax=Pongo abelii TaxID=9601 RepID=UPI0023E81AC2|nr:disrupted in schizophrenia 1 protein isoform X1 [Pongo abelii]
MPGRGPQGAPAAGGGGGVSHRAGSRDCLPPAACFRRRRLARRPGYMRSSTGPGIGFLSPAVGTLFRFPGGMSGEESYHSESRARQCGLDSRGLLVRSPVSKSAAAPAVTSVRGTSVHFGIQLRGGTRLPDRLSRPCGPGNAGWQQEFAAMDSSDTLDASWEAACSDGARRVQAAGSLPSAELSSNSCSPGCGPEVPPTPPGSHSAFTSSFSFIRLSLGSAGERGEAEGCPPSRGAESRCQSPQEMGAKAASLDGPHEDPQCLSRSFSLLATRVSADSAQAAGNSCRPERDMLSLPDVDPGSSNSLDPSLAGCGGDGSSGSGDAHSWDTLLRKWEPVLRDCLLRNRRQMEVISLRLKLQKLQEDAVENDDYDKGSHWNGYIFIWGEQQLWIRIMKIDNGKWACHSGTFPSFFPEPAETLQQRLEDLEQEKISLHFQLPSRQPALSSFLGHLAAQVQAALRRGATQQARGDDTHTPLRMEPRLLEPTAQDSLHVSITRRDWLLQEKQQLQKEIEALQARMSVLEAKDQQLRREIEEQEQQLRWQGCDLTPLVGRLSLGQLQEVSKALQDTLASAGQIPFHAEPPETIKSLQERIKSLNLSLKEITTKVCMSEKFCSTLRKKANDIETQLPALLEAKMHAISGNHFCMAKDLTEEIRSLTSEREGLEGLLSKLLVLSSRNVKKLGSVKEDYDRLRREVEHQETAYETSVKENTMKYMETLKNKLCSCKCPLLGKVWEADLEACQLLIQSLQLQEARGSLSVEDERQMDDLEGAACTAAPPFPPRLHSEDKRKTPLQALEEWKAHFIPSLHCAGGEQKEESYILSAELGEKCKDIGKKLLYLEDQLHTAIHSHDEDLIHILFILQIKQGEVIL